MLAGVSGIARVLDATTVGGGHAAGSGHHDGQRRELVQRFREECGNLSSRCYVRVPTDRVDNPQGDDRRG
jgi:hypothetical protein